MQPGNAGWRAHPPLGISEHGRAETPRCGGHHALAIQASAPCQSASSVKGKRGYRMQTAGTHGGDGIATQPITMRSITQITLPAPYGVGGIRASPYSRPNSAYENQLRNPSTEVCVHPNSRQPLELATAYPDRQPALASPSAGGAPAHRHRRHERAGESAYPTHRRQASCPLEGGHEVTLSRQDKIAGRSTP